MRLKVLSYVAFLVFIITTQSLPSADAAASSELRQVYDVTGEKVLHNAPYYIGPVIWAKGGGIKLTDTKDKKKIPDVELKPPPNFVTTDGSFETAATCFQVMDYPKPTIPKVHSYMLQYCPTFCGAGPRGCFNVSLIIDKGVRYLGYSGTAPFEFVFQKAK
ncbi:hypothetical protein E3N88_41867 [Mikania micrantha]|uniref:Uncharacterized protein n=1 Tax=Mikania micrantha TaxID=192012 RepID=A0A5N6LJH2_9ASTR|nr:hypothetical protein E3N88_41867 [Mikania micrantha]